MSQSQPSPSGKGRPQGSPGFAWRAFFHHSTTPVFVLGKTRRLRYANPAWEKLTNLKLADALGMVCSRRRYSTPLARALAPSPEALAGQNDRVRSPAPPGRNGPPWWDVQFAPLQSADGVFGIVGFITVVGEAVSAAARKIPANVVALRDRHTQYYTLDLLSGESRPAQRLVSQTRLAASLAAPVWVLGETGSGKETVARVIHHTSAVRDRAFIAIDCVGLQPYLVESLLFGHGGLSTSDRVGTVYLKDPSALPRDLQQRLADHFTTHAQTRLICGSKRSAQEAVNAGQLVPAYQTLLSAFELRVPPLRERMDDFPRLATRLVNRAIDPVAIAVLRTHTWPENLREFAETLRSSLPATGPILRDHLPFELRLKTTISRTTPQLAVDLPAILEGVEKRMIQLALARTNQHQTDAAALLGIVRAKLARRMQALGIAETPAKPGDKE